MTGEFYLTTVYKGGKRETLWMLRKNGEYCFEFIDEKGSTYVTMDEMINLIKAFRK